MPITSMWHNLLVLDGSGPVFRSHLRPSGDLIESPPHSPGCLIAFWIISGHMHAARVPQYTQGLRTQQLYWARRHMQHGCSFTLPLTPQLCKALLGAEQHNNVAIRHPKSTHSNNNGRRPKSTPTSDFAAASFGPRSTSAIDPRSTSSVDPGSTTFSPCQRSKASTETEGIPLTHGAPRQAITRIVLGLEVALEMPEVQVVLGMVGGPGLQGMVGVLGVVGN